MGPTWYREELCLFIYIMNFGTKIRETNAPAKYSARAKQQGLDLAKEKGTVKNTIGACGRLINSIP